MYCMYCHASTLSQSAGIRFLHLLQEDVDIGLAGGNPLQVASARTRYPVSRADEDSLTIRQPVNEDDIIEDGGDALSGSPIQ